MKKKNNYFVHTNIQGSIRERQASITAVVFPNYTCIGVEAVLRSE